MTIVISASLTNENVNLEQKVGIDRIKHFLSECNDGRIKDFDQRRYAYLLKYAERYTLIKKDDSSYRLGEYGIELKNILDKNSVQEDEKIEIIIKILSNNREGCGCWIVNKDILMNEQFYVFEAKDEGDVSYDYALFLYDLGIIEEPRKWKNNEDIRHCKKTNFGQNLSRIMNQDFQKKELKIDTLIIAENVDNSSNPTVNYGLMTGGVTGGKGNNR